jgi:CHASE3 domain sensor protein
MTGPTSVAAPAESAPPEPGPAARSRWTLFRRLTLTFIVLGVLVVAGAVTAAVSLARLNSAQHRQVDRLDPAIQTTTDLFISLLNQETGLRGYALTRNQTFLQPYTDGRADTTKYLTRLRAQLSGEPQLLGDVSRLAATARDWQQVYAEPGLRVIQQTPKGAIPNLPFQQGKTRFDQIRADYNRLNTSFNTARRQARDQLRTSTVWLIALVIAAVVLATLTSIALWRALSTPCRHFGARSGLSPAAI